ncbi:MAG TPA: alkaline phosphatase [Armatimonadota bacterium]
MDRRLLKAALITMACSAPIGASQASPSIKITPPDGARFAVDQRFDLRIEAKAASGSLKSLRLSLDSKPIPATLDANGSVTLRGLSSTVAGPHVITASAEDGSGSGSASATFEVVDSVGDARPARNIIFFLGDGMGASHRTAARIMRYGVANGRPKGHLAMDRLQGTAMVSTHSLNSIVTDSSPGMSCYVTGNKANNNQEGVYPDNTVAATDAADQSLSFDNPRVEYLSEYLHRKLGKVTGIVTTADVEDATPAANAVHTANRNAGTGICDQYFDERDHSGLRVLMGGGRRWFLPNTAPGSSRSAKTDYQFDAASASALGVPAGAIDPGRDLISNFVKDGYYYASNRAELNVLGGGTTKLLGLFGYGNMNVAWDKLSKRRNPSAEGVVDDYLAPDQPMLDEMTVAALQVLNHNPQGFYLMVEGAHIDKQSHLMDADRAVVEVLELDRAVQVARDFADKKGAFANRAGEAGDTVIIVAADHECSGLSIIGASKETTAALRALPADKKQAAVGTYDAAGFPAYPLDSDGYPTDLDPDGRMLFGFGANADRTEDWLSKPRPLIDSLLPTSLSDGLKAKGYLPAAGTGGPTGTYGTIQRNAATGYFIAGQVPGDQAVHSATDIPLTAYGPGWLQYRGEIDNTDVFFSLLRSAMGGYGDATAGVTGDVNGDGKVDLADLVLLLRRAVLGR